MTWDWTTTAQWVFTIAVGGGIAGWAASHFLEVSLLRVAAHPSVRKLANAADRFSQGDSGGWPGLIAKGLDFVTGGRFGAGGGFGGLGGRAAVNNRVMVVDAEGRLVGETTLDKIPQG